MHYFFDPVLFAPTVGCMLMCLTASCIGVFVVLRKESLLGEALSHAAYPGVIAALLLLKIFFPNENSYDPSTLAIILAGAFLSCLLGMYIIRFLQKRGVSQDAALAFVLSSFFGLGILFLSLLQSDYPTLYREMQALLFGQAATMVNMHVVIYAGLAIFTIVLVVLLRRPIQVVIFDSTFAQTIGVSQKRVEALLFFLIIFATVIGIRSVGVVLLSAVLIFTAANGRFFVKSLPALLLVASLIGVVSGFLGVVFSHELSRLFTMEHKKALSLPTGPMIVLWASVIFIMAALFAPRRGLLFRWIRKVTFLTECRQENLLKAIWKWCSSEKETKIAKSVMYTIAHENALGLSFLIFCLRRKGFLRVLPGEYYELTPVGMLWGRKIVRLHRLWEVYLVEYCKLAKDRVHPLAEEMEHIITEDIEEELLVLLHHPRQDPHNAPIPAKEGEIR